MRNAPILLIGGSGVVGRRTAQSAARTPTLMPKLLMGGRRF